MTIRVDSLVAVAPVLGEVRPKKDMPCTRKIQNATMKKFYENKIASLSTSQKIPLHLLKLMCQDAPVEGTDLKSKFGRKLFVFKCKRYYQQKLREIERSEKSWFFGLF